jgi:hypothetical protein
MMFKVTQGFSLQQSLKHPDLVRRFLQGHQALNLKEGHPHLKHLIHTSGHPSLKMEKCWEYLESQAGISGSMKNSNLINSILPVSDSSTLSDLFILETKEIKEGGGKGVLAHRRSHSSKRFRKLTHGCCSD